MMVINKKKCNLTFVFVLKKKDTFNVYEYDTNNFITNLDLIGIRNKIKTKLN